MSLKKLAWKLGFTKERKEELSDLLYDEGVVSFKQYEPAQKTYYTMLSPEVPPMYSMMSGKITQAMISDEKYSISFKGGKEEFDLDDQPLFLRFNMGDRVKLAYKEVYNTVHDYSPPDFSGKRQVKKDVSRRVFISAEKIE